MMTEIKINHELHRQIIAKYCENRGITQYKLDFFTYGANNALYHLKYKRHTAVAKIGVNSNYKQLHIEYAVLKKLKRPVPQAIDFFSDAPSGTQVLFQRFIRGTHLFTFDQTDLVRIGSAIASYHYPRKKIIPLKTENHREFLNGRILPVNESLDNRRYVGLFRDLFIKTGQLSEKIDNALNAPPAVLVHGDLIPQNILRTDYGNFVIIDWEGARFDDPEADLATLIKAFKLNAYQVQILIDSYGNHIDETNLHYRLLLHYLQVIAWRLAIQLNCENDEWKYNRAVAETEEELTSAERMLSELQ